MSYLTQGYWKHQPCVRSFCVREEYDFIFDDKSYEVRRQRRDISQWNKGGWDYVIYGTSTNQRRFCDPGKPTFKRVLAAFLQAYEGA